FDCIHCRKATTKPQSVKGAFLRMLTVLRQTSGYNLPLLQFSCFLSAKPPVKVGYKSLQKG
ncbi:hypothetical protein, partial [Phocaeicola coprocola]|uniref:hypothetical protein n=1 Tax=Phocaeicola coprocola TaxID=310298 RepID=UPI0032C08982